jgi:uncharacterized protein (DUF2267 family)
MSFADFVARVAEREGTTPELARHHAAAVFATLRDALTAEEFHDLLSELPRAYAEELTHA